MNGDHVGRYANFGLHILCSSVSYGAQPQDRSIWHPEEHVESVRPGKTFGGLDSHGDR